MDPIAEPALDPAVEPGGREQFVTTTDGLDLFVNVYGRPTGHVPVVCLPGLTRNGRDYVALATELAPERLVASLDFRGRGRSAYDPTAATYRPDVYASDVVTVLDALGLERACLVGTSMGGSVAMHVGAGWPARVAGIVLNDVGPKLEPEGFARIQGYVGKLPTVSTWAEAVAQLRDLAGPAVLGLSDAEWEARTRQQYREFEPGSIRPDHDPAIVRGMEAVDATAIPDSWPLFDRLAGIPLLEVRGALSDLFSAATVEEMRRRRPDLHVLVVEDRGHCPTLDEPESRRAIRDFLATL